MLSEKKTESNFDASIDNKKIESFFLLSPFPAKEIHLFLEYFFNVENNNENEKKEKKNFIIFEVDEEININLFSSNFNLDPSNKLENENVFHCYVLKDNVEINNYKKFFDDFKNYILSNYLIFSIIFSLSFKNFEDFSLWRENNFICPGCFDRIIKNNFNDYKDENNIFSYHCDVLNKDYNLKEIEKNTISFIEKKYSFQIEALEFFSSSEIRFISKSDPFIINLINTKESSYNLPSFSIYDYDNSRKEILSKINDVKSRIKVKDNFLKEENE